MTGMEDVLAAHKPTLWHSFTNENEILRCCGQDFGNATRKPSRDDADKTWAAWSAHVAEALTAAGFGNLHDAWSDAISRVEVIDDTGRAYTKYTPAGTVSIDRQDQGRTLKVFITEGATKKVSET